MGGGAETLGDKLVGWELDAVDCSAISVEAT